MQLTGKWPGVLLAGAVAALALALAQAPWLRGLGLSALTLSILLGMALGNAWPGAVGGRFDAGVDFCKSWLLRTGIVLYGFRVSWQDFSEVGWLGIGLALVVVASVFALAWWLGTRLLRLDRDTSVLIGAGCAICGAAAILATQALLHRPGSADEHKLAGRVSVAVATIVVFGTLAMFLYPLAYAHLGLSEQAYGLFAGGTIHEVAQVVAAGEAVGPAAARVAVIEKMLRVMLLAPFLLLLGLWFRRAEDGAGRGSVVLPWFALGFVAASGVHSLRLLPEAMVTALVWLDMALLALAMAALGLRTRWSAIRQAGLKPLQLGLLLTALLAVGGYVGVRALSQQLFQ